MHTSIEYLQKKYASLEATENIAWKAKSLGNLDAYKQYVEKEQAQAIMAESFDLIVMHLHLMLLIINRVGRE